VKRNVYKKFRGGGGTSGHHQGKVKAGEFSKAVEKERGGEP